MIDVAKVVREAIEWCVANSVAHPLGLDFIRKCEDEWSKDYAVFRVNINEPDDSLRRMLDLDQVKEDVRKMVLESLGKKFKLARADGYVLKPGLVLRCHSIGHWGFEFEAYRTRCPPVPSRSALRAPSRKAAKKVARKIAKRGARR